jgi:hypothetical protein
MADYSDFDFSKELDVDVEFDLNSDVDVEFNKDVDLDINVKQDVDLDGNFASATFSVEAIGTNTLAEADVHVLVIEGKLSSVDGVLIAAAN